MASVTANVIRGVTLNEAGSYVYDLNGNLRSWSLTGRATALHIYNYDELNRLTTLTRQNFTEPMTWNYATDKVGRKTTDGTKFRWEYDALGRLTREQYDANANWTLDSANDYITTFAYDLVGNRKKKVTDKLGTTSDETVTYVYNSRDELTSETSTLSGSTTYVYDANGSLTSKTKGAAVETYGYDKRNKMTSYTSSTGVVTSYKYDDEGLRVQRKVGTAAATLYLLNHHNLTGYAVVMEERSGTSTSMPTVAYVVGHDVVRQSQDAAGTGTTDGHLHLVYDGQGNMRGNVGTINVGPTTIFATVGGTRDYSAFGELIGTGSLVSNLRHHGEYFDGITGFYFQGVRQRVTHWWTQRDPYQGTIWQPLTLHSRNFVDQDPINGHDSSGNIAEFTLGGLLGTALVGMQLSYGMGVTPYRVGRKFGVVNPNVRPVFGPEVEGLFNSAAQNFEIATAWLTGFAEGAAQGVLNVVNGLQDAVIDVVNLGVQASLAGQAASWFGIDPTISSPDWSYGVVYNEPQGIHIASKFLGGQGAMTLLTVGAGTIVASAGRSAQAGEIYVIGRQADAARYAGQAGFNVLNDPAWTLAGNDAWIQSAIDTRSTVLLASEPTVNTFFDYTSRFFSTVTAREVDQLMNAGYTFVLKAGKGLLLPP